MRGRRLARCAGCRVVAAAPGRILASAGWPFLPTAPIPWPAVGGARPHVTGPAAGIAHSRNALITREKVRQGRTGRGHCRTRGVGGRAYLRKCRVGDHLPWLVRCVRHRPSLSPSPGRARSVASPCTNTETEYRTVPGTWSGTGSGTREPITPPQGGPRQGCVGMVSASTTGVLRRRQQLRQYKTFPSSRNRRR